MNFLCTLITRVEGNEPVAMALSPSDNVWFVPADKLPPEFEKFQGELQKATNAEVLGHILVGDDWKPE